MASSAKQSTRYRRRHVFGIQLGVEQLRKLEHKMPQIRMALEGNPRQVVAKQAAGRAHHQVGVGDVTHRHLGHDAHAQAQSHIGFDHVGVDGFQGDARRQLLGGKRLVDAGAACERGVVGDDGLIGQVGQFQLRHLGQRMVGGQHQHMLPFVAGQGDQLGVVGQAFGGDANFGGFVHDHARHLVGCALVQADVHTGVGAAQLGHRDGQHIARLGVGGGNRQGSRVLAAVLLADALQVVDLAQDDVNAFEHMLARLGHAFQAFAVTAKNLNAQLAFQFQNGFGHARLRGVQIFGNLGQVEVAAHRLLYKTKLMQIHGLFRIRNAFIMPF